MCHVAALPQPSTAGRAQVCAQQTARSSDQDDDLFHVFREIHQSTEEWQTIVTVRDIPSANVDAPRSATVAARMGAGLAVTSTAAIRHALRALASETGLQKTGLRGKSSCARS